MTNGPDHPMMQEPGWVYVFKREDGLRKVGWTARLGPRRWACKSATGLAHTLEWCKECDGRGWLGACKATQFASIGRLALAGRLPTRDCFGCEGTGHVING